MERAASSAAAVAGIADGAVMAIGGEDASTLPWALVDGIRLARLRDLHVVCHEPALLSEAVRALLAVGGVARLTCAGDGAQAGEIPDSIEVRWLPRTDLNQRLEAADAGIPSFFGPVGTEGDTAEVRYGGRTYRREEALHCDVALIRASRVDAAGSLVLDTGPVGIEARMAKAGGLTLVQADTMAEERLRVSEVHVPGVHVNRVLSPRTWQV